MLADEYTYDGMRVIEERDSNKVPVVNYARGSDLSGSLEGAGGIGGLLARTDGYNSSTGAWTNSNFYFADANGNITALVDTNQSLSASYRYDPFGNTISQSGIMSDANVYRFSSKEIHLASGMYYYGYRFYDPSLQRWVNRDPGVESGFRNATKRRAGEPSEVNAFFFVGNGPVIHVDPFGLDIDDCLNDCDRAKSGAGIKEVQHLMRHTWYVHAGLGIGTVICMLTRNVPGTIVFGLADAADLAIRNNAGDKANKRANDAWIQCCDACGKKWNDPEKAKLHTEGKD